MSNSVFQGVVRGKTIELDQEPGLPEGQPVTVTVQAMPTRQKLPAGEGLRRSFGAWSEDAADLDEYLAWNRRQRGLDRRGIEE
ncbi:MAG: hypothetical protein JNM56_06450 [Planctomycetia bacterium]|nr:hypothetical protein [Planctomycetia bacterium]